MIDQQEYLVILNVPTSLEETVVDFLLLQESEHGFSSYPVYAHHHQSRGLSLAEQVSGRQKKVRFQFHIDDASLANFLTALKQELADSGIRYWVLPVIAEGTV